MTNSYLKVTHGYEFWNWPAATIWLRYLLEGSPEQYLSAEWLKTRLPEHEAYTNSQLIPGMARIQADVAEMRRREFWKGLEDRRPRATVMAFPRKQSA